MSHIFVSYSHDDSKFINRLSQDLLDVGHSVWQDTLNLRGGSDWSQEIDHAIDNAEPFLLVWSANSDASGYVRNEIERAESHARAIIPILISGDILRMPESIRKLQHIDFRGDFSTAFAQLTSLLKLPPNANPPPNFKAMLQEGKTTFRSAERLWRSTISFSDGDDGAVGLLLKRTENDSQAYLVGRRKDLVSTPEHIQVYLQFSGAVSYDSFDEYLAFARVEGYPLWTVLVRGPISRDPKGGLAYKMPLHQAVWHEAVELTWEAINRVGATSKPLKVFSNAPVALSMAFGAREHFKRSLEIYQQNRDGTKEKDRYFCAYSYTFG